MIEKNIDSEKIDKEWEEQERKMIKYMDQVDMEQRFLKLYSKFSNFPQSIKKNIITRIAFIIGIIILVFTAVFYLDYKNPVIFLIATVIPLFLLWQIFITFFYLKHAHFITFTGKITESYPVGTKITGNKHFVLKIISDSGKELCFPYYGSESFVYDQYLTLFINNNAKIDLSQWGPYLSQYIEVIPTDEIEARMELLDSVNSDSLKATDYLKD